MAMQRGDEESNTAKTNYQYDSQLQSFAHESPYEKML